MGNKNIPIFTGSFAEPAFLLCSIAGMPEITTKQEALSLFKRMNIMERINGAYQIEDGEPRFTTMQDCYDCIGVKTNTSSLNNRRFKDSAYATLRARSGAEAMLQLADIAKKEDS